MSNDPSNPFQSPSGDSYQDSPDTPSMPAPPRESIDYFGPFSQFFEHPNWVTNMLLPSLVLLIPILGVMVVWGYMFEAIALLLTGRSERPYHGFTFDRFGDYLMRGLWIMLAMFCLGLLFSIPLMIVVGALNFAAQAADGPARGVLAILAFVVQFGAQILINLVTMPAMIRVGLTKEFSEGFNFGFMIDFFKKMWLDQILVILFTSIAGMVVGIVGALACCVGILPAMILMMFVMTMLNMQLYQVYLHRGGQTIPIAP
ncbi:DUF4013 domain-containing protein [Blastopirellula sp. J2-11]|uniref:DUF4013 domain-containing protein n=1 Tax=Blastopirellula sp. J2-11 TaxID=2943192 RepID=UPI0021C94F32|nr:DUF4013 domain-containing protein [Blastopirellula sp. J2-11]UUO06662.1 DUF4013 domain-containing protein [Blastopirellula sp. J2-11]